MTGARTRAAADAIGFGGTLPPKRMILLDWKPIGIGALVGRVAVELPYGLQISDITVFAKDGGRWATMPAEMLRDTNGQPLKDERGKARYRSSLKWRDRQLQERFSEAVIALVEAQHGPIGGMP